VGSGPVSPSRHNKATTMKQVMKMITILGIEYTPRSSVLYGAFASSHHRGIGTAQCHLLHSSDALQWTSGKMWDVPPHREGLDAGQELRPIEEMRLKQGAHDDMRY
jgi:hypothetical protein